jgi:hypothetical protein
LLLLERGQACLSRFYPARKGSQALGYPLQRGVMLGLLCLDTGQAISQPGLYRLQGGQIGGAGLGAVCRHGWWLLWHRLARAALLSQAARTGRRSFGDSAVIGHCAGLAFCLSGGERKTPHAARSAAPRR